MPFYTLHHSYKITLEVYGAIVWFPYILSNTQRIDIDHNRFLSFTEHCLNVVHSQHNYRIINELNSNHYSNVTLFLAVVLFGHWLTVPLMSLVYWNNSTFTSQVILEINLFFTYYYAEAIIQKCTPNKNDVNT